MQTALLTGSSGKVGRATRAALEADGWNVRPFDIAEGADLRDESAVLNAMRGCEKVIHAGAIAHDLNGTPAEIVATNVLGTWHVLSAAEQLGIHRVIYFSSAQVFGCAEGEGEPLYLPIDDAHPLRAARPYGMSKRLAEEMCAAWSSRTRIPTVVLRPVLILTDDELSMMSESEAELGAFVHVDDVANAVCQALTAPVRLHARLILCGPGSFDSGLAERTLDWRPAHATWTS